MSHATGQHELRTKVIEQLQLLHSVKAAALRMFGVMLPAVRAERDEGALPEVADLLERMTRAFGGHEEQTRAHEQALRERLEALGARPSRVRNLALGTGALLRVHLGGVGGQNHGANARDAFVFEHVEIACGEMLEQLAERAGDPQTAELARSCRAEDDEMAATIRRNFTNVLSLMLASEGLPTQREQPAALV
jgi:ferritin-like metal-binding protein YciE